MEGCWEYLRKPRITKTNQMSTCSFPLCKSIVPDGQNYCIGHGKIMGEEKQGKKKVVVDKIKQAELDLWFLERRREMTGICMNCGGQTTKDDPQYWKFSIAHILPKRETMFPSVATNPHNWLELCHFGNACHAEFDSSWMNASEMPVFKVAMQRFELFKDKIAAAERKRIPYFFTQNY